MVRLVCVRACLEADCRFLGGRPVIPAPFNLSGSCSNKPLLYRQPYKDTLEGGETPTANVMVHLSAAILLLARLAKVSLPSYASRRVSLAAELFGFSSTKNTKEIMAKNVVYI